MNLNTCKQCQFDLCVLLLFIEMAVQNQLQRMCTLYEPLDRAQSRMNIEPSFVKIWWRVQKLWASGIVYFWSIVFPRLYLYIVLSVKILHQNIAFSCISSNRKQNSRQNNDKPASLLFRYLLSLMKKNIWYADL